MILTAFSKPRMSAGKEGELTAMNCQGAALAVGAAKLHSGCYPPALLPPSMVQPWRQVSLHVHRKDSESCPSRLTVVAIPCAC